jgi:hypothetical protein
MGVNPSTPPDSAIYGYDPTTNDTQFIIGTLWINPVDVTIWMLTGVSDAIANWVQLYPGGGAGATDFPTNSGTAVESGGVLNMLGANVIATSGASHTVTVALSNGTNGQTLIGGGSSPVWANITSNASTITITNGANSIDLSVTSEAVDQFVTDSGTAVPVGGHINILGTNLVTTSGSGHTVTVGLTEGTNGQLPIAATGGNVAYANITSHDGSVTITNGANTIDLSVGGGGSSTSNFLYYQATNSSALSAGTYYLGAIVALTKVFDAGNNVSPGNGSGTAAVFTAPTKGVYLLGGAVANVVAGSPASMQMNIQTSQGDFPLSMGNTSFNNVDERIIIELNQNDTVMWSFNWSIGGATQTVEGGSVPYLTYIYGYLVMST